MLKYIIPFSIFFAGLSAMEDFQELLKCNLANVDVAKFCDVDKEMYLYQESLTDESNYQPVSRLEDWDTCKEYPKLQPQHQPILDIIKGLNITSVAEVGAGAGRVAKYVYAQNPSLDMTCIEWSAEHVQQMQENFTTRCDIIQPTISVNAKIVKGSLPDLGEIPSNSFDLVYTCTVMMHLPFIPAILSAKEITRISSRYILHVENKNQGMDWYNMAVVRPKAMSTINYQGIDYVKLYEKLGVKTVKCFEFQDPHTPATYIVYFGEKISHLTK